MSVRSAASDFRWLNEPPAWQRRTAMLEVTTGDKTDFWRKTHYGFIRDNGHFRYRELTGDFTATLAFSGEYQELYDQAGLMLRIDAAELDQGRDRARRRRQMLSAVVTRDYSDWSTMPLARAWNGFSCGARAQAQPCGSNGRTGSGTFTLFRLAYLPESRSLLVGPMCCSPQRAGFTARFRPLDIGPATADALHG